MQTQLCLKQILEVNWTTTVISDVYTRPDFKSWTIMHCKLWLKFFFKWKWEQFELGIKPRINLYLIFSVNRSDRSFSLYRWNFNWYKLINTIDNMDKLKMRF